MATVGKRRERHWRLEEVHNQSFRSRGRQYVWGSKSRGIRMCKTKACCGGLGTQSKREDPQSAAALLTCNCFPGLFFLGLYTCCFLCLEKSLSTIPTAGLS